MSRVLVTGATGFVGREAVAALQRAGHQVHAIARRVPEHAWPGVRWHVADLLAEGSAAATIIAASEAEVLVHLAWYAEHGKFWTAPENAHWVEATLRLLRAFAQTDRATRVVMAGTCAEYQWNRAVYAEGDTCRPRTLYGAAKHGLHVVAESFAAERGISFAWGRVFFLYGPGEAPGRFVPAIARQLQAGGSAKMSAGTQVRDFLHVSDAGGAFAALAASDVEGAINIASGSGVSLLELAKLVARHAGGAGRLQVGAIPLRPDDPPSLVADVSRLRDLVGWYPRIALNEGVAQSVAWQRGD